MKILSIFLFHLIVCIGINNAQVRINEVCTNNDNTIMDEDGDYSDWIELYNHTNENISLAGYQLQDNTTTWSFPDITIEAKSFLIVFASKKDYSGTEIHTNFSLSKDGEQLSLLHQTQVVDRLQIPALEDDQSYGTDKENINQWGLFSEPTPNASNDNNSFIPYASSPIIDISSSVVTLTSGTANTTIHFTTNGSIPTSSSPVYTQPFTIQEPTIVKAFCVATNYLNSPLSYRTLFPSVDHELPIISLSGEDADFFSEEKGILVKGPDADSSWPFYGANYWKDIEINAHFEYLTPKGHPIIQSPIGIKIHGGRGTRTKPQKALRLVWRNEYSQYNINYPFFEEKDISQFKRLLLRNSGADNNITHCRDGLLQHHLLSSETTIHLDMQAYQAVNVYINGEYYGILNLRERIDKYYLQANHFVDINNIDLLEEDTIVVEGSFEEFTPMYEYTQNNDLSISSHFEQASSYFDILNLADYFIVQTTINNNDTFRGNIKYWRERKPGAKWRYLLFDLDPIMGRYSWTKADQNILEQKLNIENNIHINLFHSFWANVEFRYYFLNRYADLLNTVFSTPQLTHAIEKAQATLQDDIQQHFIKWPQTDYTDWNTNHFDELYTYANQRPPYARKHLIDYFDLVGEYPLTISTFPNYAGNIQLNTISINDSPWSGFYFKEIPIDITAIAHEGYEFSHWKINDELVFDIGAIANFNLDQASHITAYFTPINRTPNIQIFPNPVNTESAIAVQFNLLHPSIINYTLYNTLGQSMGNTQSVKLEAGNRIIDIPLSTMASGTYILQLHNQQSGESFTQKIIVQ